MSPVTFSQIISFDTSHSCYYFISDLNIQKIMYLQNYDIGPSQAPDVIFSDFMNLSFS